MDNEKVYCSMYSRNAELYHHGIKGQKWGVQNGPPYPLDSNISTGKRLKNEKNIDKIQKERAKTFLKALNKNDYTKYYKLCDEIVENDSSFKKIVNQYSNLEATKFEKDLRDDKLPEKYIEKTIDYLLKHFSEAYSYFKDDRYEMYYEVKENGLNDNPTSAFYFYCKDKKLDPSEEVAKQEKMEEKFKDSCRKAINNTFGSYSDIKDKKGFLLENQVYWQLYEKYVLLYD